ncbi:hypothetical protein Hdeb2414_s0001g00004471 [Helianthus debilis subsp. tardiflorus]
MQAIFDPNNNMQGLKKWKRVSRRFSFASRGVSLEANRKGAHLFAPSQTSEFGRWGRDGGGGGRSLPGVAEGGRG